MNPAFAVCLLLLLSATGALAYRKILTTRVERKLAVLADRVCAVLDEEPETVNISSVTTFSTALDDAGFSTRLQTPRLRIQYGDGCDPPEKYKIFARLAGRGMSSEEIAETLSISPAEADQLAHLFRLRDADGRQRNQG